jgi:hypothetical protein
MAKIETQGKFPKRIGDYILYNLDDTTIIRVKSGFTAADLKTAPKYEPCRQTAKEFGSVSYFCKQMRMALYGILPKQNNLALVNALTKKMREVMTYDATAARGERHLVSALTSNEGKQQLRGYNFNPEVETTITCQINKDTLTFKTKDILFAEKVSYVGFRVHHLAFDFGAVTHELVSTNWILESKTSLPKRLCLALPIKPNTSGNVFTLLEVQFYTYASGTYVPMLEDKSKSVLVVDLV